MFFFNALKIYILLRGVFCRQVHYLFFSKIAIKRVEEIHRKSVLQCAFLIVTSVTILLLFHIS